MNVASQPLCQELYELLGWDDGLHSWVNDDGRVVVELTPFAVTPPHPVLNYLSPAYTLGYLLRKLPESLKGSTAVLTLRVRGGTWFARYGLRGPLGRGDNPEDAACALATRLAKAGILKREGE